MERPWSYELRILNKKRKNAKLCDFELKLGEVSLPVHRVVLRKSSEYFRAMLDSGMKESLQGYCCISNADACIVRECIDFMYTGSLNITAETVVDVFKISHQLLVTGAGHICEEFMLANLDRHNCVEWFNLASLYELEELQSESRIFIAANARRIINLHCLPKTELNDLLMCSQDSLYTAIVSWSILRGEISDKTFAGAPVCQMVKTFPVESLTEYIFKEGVLQDHHVRSCATCSEYVTGRRKAHLSTKKDITLDNCVELKGLAVTHGANTLATQVHDFIILHFEQVCVQRLFTEIVTPDELLCYINKVDSRSCTLTEFKGIVSWFKLKPERHFIFPKLFPKKDKCSSKYQESLSSLKGEKSATNRSTYFRHRSRSSAFWLITTDNCCFVRNLAETFNCQYTLTQADTFISDHFASISQSDDIKHLSFDAMMHYLTIEHLYVSNGGISQWEALKRWIELQENKTYKEDFIRLFNALLLDKMSTDILNTISSYKLVRECPLCTSNLMRSIFSHISQTSESIRKTETALQHHISQTSERIRKTETALQRQISQASERIRKTETALHMTQHALEHQEHLVHLNNAVSCKLFEDCDFASRGREEKLRQEMKETVSCSVFTAIIAICLALWALRY